MNKKITKKNLENLKSENAYRNFVIDCIVKESGDDDIDIFMQDIVNYGLINGTCSSLIYTADIKKVFNRYSEEILEFYDELLNQYGEVKNRFNLPSKVFLVYFTFEEITKELLDELYLEN